MQRRTYPQIMVLRYMALHPTSPVHGFELCTVTNLTSGTIYPLLKRLAEKKLIKEKKRKGDHRRFYVLTTSGAELGRKLLDELAYTPSLFT